MTKHAMNATNRDGKFYLAPEGDAGDYYAAGYEGNVFESRADAEAAIQGLVESLDSPAGFWSVQQY